MSELPQSQPPSAYFAACPQRRPRRRWPLIIGILSIVMAILDLGTASLMLSPSLSVGCFAIALMTPRCLAAAMLLAGGVLVIQHKPLGRTLLIVWAKIALVFLGLLAILVVLSLGDLADVSHGRDVSFVPIILLCALIFAVAGMYPVFLICWMNRGPVERDISRW